MVMKRILFVLLSVLFINTSLFAQWESLIGNSAGKKELATNKKASLEWTQKEYDFGEVKHNNPQKIEFEFTNTGDKPIIITKAEASCGCTSLEYSKEPVLPGKKSYVSTVFDAKSLGTFSKTITVYFNIEAPHNVFDLKVKGVVVN